MVFSSIPFLFFFFPLFLIIYYLVPFKHKGIRWKNIVLLIFSLIFYAWGEPVYILLMIFSSLVDYYSGKLGTGFYGKVALVHGEMKDKIELGREVQKYMEVRNRTDKVIIVNKSTEILL